VTFHKVIALVVMFQAKDMIDQLIFMFALVLMATLNNLLYANVNRLIIYLLVLACYFLCKTCSSYDACL